MKRKERRKKPRIPMDSPLYKLMEYALLLTGALLIALSFNLLLNPNRIASGGVAGISTILDVQFGWEPAWTQWGLNIPLFIAGVLTLGGRFGVKTAVGSGVLPLFVLLTSSWDPLTENPLLAAIYGGIGVGTGLGLVFRGRGSTGGLDLAAQILHKYTGLSLGLAIALFDGLVIVTAGLLLSAEMAMYALIGLFVASRTIDLVQTGFGYSKVAYIISKAPEAIRDAILHDLDRGLTKLTGHGGYTNQERIIWMVVVGQNEVTRLKALVRSIDPDAFVILTDSKEVLGEGFRVGP